MINHQDLIQNTQPLPPMLEAWLLQLECLDVHRFGAMDELENMVVELLARVKVTN
jgi:hypothetical protein